MKRRERERAPEPGSPEDPRFVAAVDMVGRTGAKGFQIRYDEEQDPIVWVAVAEYRGGAWETGAGMTPLIACLRLLDQLIDGGTCTHCGKPTGVTDDWRQEMPLAEIFCWYVFDPELEKFRRSCEGD